MRKLFMSILTALTFISSLYAQSPRSTIRAGAGVLFTDMDLMTGPTINTTGETVGPALFVEYDYRFVKNLSCAVWMSSGQVSYYGLLHDWHDTGGLVPYNGVYDGVISHANHLSAAAILLFRPLSWAEVGFGIVGECREYTHAQNTVHDIIYGSPDSLDEKYGSCSYMIMERARTFKYGIVMPVRLHLYSNARLEVSAFYHFQFLRQEKGRWAKGTNYAGISLGVKL